MGLTILSKLKRLVYGTFGGFEEPSKTSRNTFQAQPVAESLSNQDLPINRLPNELLGEIFLAAIENGGNPEPTRFSYSYAPLNLTHTCSHWREISQSFPALWTRIYLRFGQHPNPELLHIWLKGTLDMPLHLYISRLVGHTSLENVLGEQKDAWGSCIDLLIGISSQWADITIWDGPAGQLDRISTLKHGDLCNLVAVDVIPSDGEPLSNMDPFWGVVSQSTALRRVGCNRIPDCTFPWAQLTHLHLGLGVSCHRAMSILQLCLNLVSLFWATLNAEEIPPDIGIAHLEKLEQLKIVGYSTIQTFHLLFTPSLRRLALTSTKLDFSAVTLFLKRCNDVQLESLLMFGSIEGKDSEIQFTQLLLHQRSLVSLNVPLLDTSTRFWRSVRFRPNTFSPHIKELQIGVNMHCVPKYVADTLQPRRTSMSVLNIILQDNADMQHRSRMNWPPHTPWRWQELGADLDAYVGLIPPTELSHSSPRSEDDSM